MNLMLSRAKMELLIKTVYCECGCYFAHAAAQWYGYFIEVRKWTKFTETCIRDFFLFRKKSSALPFLNRKHLLFPDFFFHSHPLIDQIDKIGHFKTLKMIPKTSRSNKILGPDFLFEKLPESASVVVYFVFFHIFLIWLIWCKFFPNFGLFLSLIYSFIDLLIYFSFGIFVHTFLSFSEFRKNILSLWKYFNHLNFKRLQRGVIQLY